jgi:DNA-binding HxlR family transcriptional regulator
VAKQVANGHSVNMQRNAPNQLESLSSEHRALALLRLLFRVPTYRSNELFLSDWLSAIGLACSSSQLKRQLCELEESGLLETTDVEGNLIVKLSDKGADVAEGKQVVLGVLRPTPDCPY